MSRPCKDQRPSVARKPLPAGPAGGPVKKDGRDRIRPGTFNEKRSPAFEGPSVVLKDEP